MIGLVTQQGRAAVELADVAKGKRGSFPMGSRPHLVEAHTADSPSSNVPGGRTVAVPQVGGPIAQALDSHGVARTQVSEPMARTPEVLTTLNTAKPDSRHAGLASSVSCNPGRADVQHLDFTHGGTPQRVSVDPARPTFHAAPTGSTPAQPRNNANAAPIYPGARQ
ncbi:hypothetical protein [Streptomyces mirabilis]|uniref:hypothetical protein n=1 Tax=Streptomyces mirabilis TaxID=68239 RepID=UPI0036614A22